MTRSRRARHLSLMILALAVGLPTQPQPLAAQQRTERRAAGARVAATPLDGAWRRVSATLSAPDTTATTTYGQPSVFLYAGGYFSYFAFTRPPAPPLGAQATAAEKAAAYDTFISQAGRFRVRDSTLTVETLVARAPILIGTSRTSTFQRRGDTLVIVTRGGSPRDTSVAATTRTTYVRLP